VEDLETLDGMKDPSAYSRKTVEIVVPDGSKADCHTSIVYPRADHVIPDPEYFDILYRAAVSAGLPADSLEQTLGLKS